CHSKWQSLIHSLVGLEAAAPKDHAEQAHFSVKVVIINAPRPDRTPGAWMPDIGHGQLPITSTPINGASGSPATGTSRKSEASVVRRLRQGGTSIARLRGKRKRSRTDDVGAVHRGFGLLPLAALAGRFTTSVVDTLPNIL